MNPKPSFLQRMIASIVMQKPITEALSNVTEPLDNFFLAISGGRFAISEIAGMPIVQLESRGARTGQLRTHPLLGVRDGEKIALLGTNYGRKNHPAWVFNLRANPECSARARNITKKYRARETAGDEYEKYFQCAIDIYKGYAFYRQRAAPRHVAVFVLEPAE